MFILTFKPPHDKTNKMACALSEDSDQPGYPPCLIRVFAVRMNKARVLSYPLSAQRRLRSAWASHSEDSDQTGQMPRLIWVFAGRTVILLVLSWGGSYIFALLFGTRGGLRSLIMELPGYLFVYLQYIVYKQNNTSLRLRFSVLYFCFIQFSHQHL